MSDAPRPPWWRGARGEWFVAAQFALGALVLLGPRHPPGWPPWPAAIAGPAGVAGLVLLVLGHLLLFAGAARLGRHMTPLPEPKANAELVVTGIFRLVRHPIYAGVSLLVLGWSLRTAGSLTLGWALALVLLLDRKSRHEERWLRAKFPGYAAYCRRVRRFIPYIY